MKFRLPLLFATTGVVSFVAGAAATAWLQSPTGSAGNAIHPAPADAPPAEAAAPANARAPDVRSAVNAPADFLDSLAGESPLAARVRVTAAVAAMGLDEVLALARNIPKENTGNALHWTMMTALFDRWAELDPDSLLAAAMDGWLQDPGNSQGVNSAMRELTLRDPEAAWRRAAGFSHRFAQLAKGVVLATLASTEPARALAMALEVETSQSERWFFTPIMDRWAARDPQAAIAALNALPSAEMRTALFPTVASAFASADPDAALAWGLTLDNDADRGKAIGSALGTLARSDPLRAMELARRPEFAIGRQTTLELATRTLARRDFDAAMERFLASTNPFDRKSMLKGLNSDPTPDQRRRLLALAPSLPPAAAREVYWGAIADWRNAGASGPLEILDGISSPGVRADLSMQLLLNGAMLSPDEMKIVFSRLPASSQTEDRASRLAREMASTDPEAAIAWAESLELPELRQPAVDAAIGAWARVDPTAASRKALALDDPSRRRRAIADVVKFWVSRDHKAALAWSESLDGADRAAAMGSLVTASIGSDPEATREVFARYIAGLTDEANASGQVTSAASHVGSSLAGIDPQQAAAWASSLPEGPAQDGVRSGIAAAWAAHDPMAASQWIDSLPPGTGRDRAAGNLVSTIARDDPESAWVWALTIENPATRSTAIEKTLNAWKAWDQEAAARNALESSGLPEEEVRRLSATLD